MEKKTQITINARLGFVLFCVASLALICIASVAEAETYGPVSFLLPPNWECTLEKSSDVCLNKTEKSSIALVVTYKVRSGNDNLSDYKKQLGSPRQIRTSSGIKNSQVLLVHEIDLNGQTWLEALHHNSEIVGFYTDYLVSTAGPYAVLISITVKDSVYPNAFDSLKPTVDSLRINLAERSPTQPETMPGMPSQQMNQSMPSPASQHSAHQMHIYLAVGFAVAVLFLLYAVLK